MALYSLLDMAGCGNVALHYAGVAEAGEPLDLSKTYDIHGNYATFSHCSSCGRRLAAPDLNADWFFPEVVH
ncbi:hypothetical protein [Pseudomonas sp.]|uniref:hypothetical protein n=1 Tax=Pseudomonas sp. TaxID=306 RepID=UPI002584E5FE|nr:hypothetical protein [Pseudomonas sp.]